MFTQKNLTNQTDNTTQKNDSTQNPSELSSGKYKNIINLCPGSDQTDEMNYNTIDRLLEQEKLHNKTESWPKLDKTIKIQKLHAFAEKYGKLHTLPVKDIKSLKMFFSDCLEKNKLQKTKDVVYDKETKEISSIPALFFNSTNRNFTLKIMDAKRVSTLKSLTPKRIVVSDSPSEDSTTAV